MHRQSCLEQCLQQTQSSLVLLFFLQFCGGHVTLKPNPFFITIVMLPSLPSLALQCCRESCSTVWTLSHYHSSEIILVGLVVTNFYTRTSYKRR